MVSLKFENFNFREINLTPYKKILDHLLLQKKVNFEYAAEPIYWAII